MTTPFALPAWFPRRFWDDFRHGVLERGHKPELLRWMTMRAEQFIGALQPDGPESLTRGRIEAFLRKALRESRLSDWQLRQAFEAIELTLLVLGVEAAGEIDWQFWRDSAHPLSPDHPSLARGNNPVKAADWRPEPSTAPLDIDSECEGLRWRPGSRLSPEQASSV